MRQMVLTRGKRQTKYRRRMKGEEKRKQILKPLSLSVSVSVSKIIDSISLLAKEEGEEKPEILISQAKTP